MTDMHADRSAGPERDFVGYGPQPPDVRWPGGALVAVNLVVNYEEGGEYSLREDGINTAGASPRSSTDRRSAISAPRRTWNTAAGSGSGGSAA